MSLGLTSEERNIIKDLIKYKILESKRGFIFFLRKKKLIKKIDARIDSEFGKDLGHGEIGIKSHSINIPGINVIHIFEIKMVLKINGLEVDKIISKEDYPENLIVESNNVELNRFANQLEQFILRGIDTKDIFDKIEVDGNEKIYSLFCSNNESTTIKLKESEGFLGAINLIVKDLLERGIRPPFMLLSDSYTHLKGALYNVPLNINLTTSINRYQKNIDDWFDLLYNAENKNKDDHKLVCIPKFYNSENSPFQLLQSSPLDVNFRNQGGLNENLEYIIDVSWCGAFEIKNENAIQCIKIEF